MVPATMVVRRRGVAVGSALVAVVVGLAGCTSTPPPPLVTPNSQSAVAKPVDTNEVVVGIDSLTKGLNPHALADQSASTNTLAALLLPAPFRPGPDGVPQPDPALVNSVQVTKAEPFTVTYTLRRDASWSDGAPIEAADFDYLWRQLSTAPGVVNPAGYRLITNVVSKDGGKTVEVVFSKSYPGWRSLFTNLLPAHLLKDAPAGWTGAMDENFPASGGRFAIKSIDFERSEVVIERNDRYWGKPATLDRIVFRKADATGLAAAMRSGNDQVALLSPDLAGMNLFTALGKSVRLDTVPRSTTVRLLLRPSSTKLADVRVRTAIAAALDRNALITAGTGDGPSARLRADAHVLAPSQPGYAATLPADSPVAKPNPALTDSLLTEVGYTKTSGVWMRDGRQLTLVIGVAAGREPYVAIANQVQRQLSAVGIAARVVASAGDQLFGETLAKPLPTSTPTVTPTATATATSTSVSGTGVPPVPPDDGSVDIAVAPQPVGGDASTVLASSYGCWSALPQATPSPPNVANFCDRTLQPVIDSVLTGAAPLLPVLPSIENTLWQQMVAIPLFQFADVLATAPVVSGVEPGPAFAGPFANASTWRRATR